MVKWFCSSALCFNNYTSRNSNGETLKYYRLPREERIKTEYCKIFQTSGVNWEKGHICSAHWSSGIRKNASDLPDITVPPDAHTKLQEKYVTSKNIFAKYKNPSDKIKPQYKKAKRKFELASQFIKAATPINRTPIDRDNCIPTSTRKRTPSKKLFQKRLDLSEKK